MSVAAPVPSHIPDTALLPVPGAVLMPYQQRWVAEHSPLKVMEKSRRTGITWGEASDNVLTAASQRTAGGQNVYYIAYNQDMTIEYIQACGMWARMFNYAAGEIEEGLWDGEDEADKAIKTYTIRFPSGFRIVALSSRPSNLRGRQGVIVIDEAAFHDQLKELLKAALAMLIWGGAVHVISTHNGDDNPFNELVTDIRSGRRKGVVQRVDFQEAVADGLYQRVCMRLGKPWVQAEQDEWMSGVYAFYGDGAAEELDCVPANGSGSWLSRALIESRMSADTPVLRYACKAGFEVLPDHIRTADVRDWMEATMLPLLERLPTTNVLSFDGEDFGRTGDLSVHVPLLQHANLVRRVPFTVELRNVPFQQQEQICFFLLDRLPRFTGGAFDSRGNGQYLGERAMQRFGASRIAQVMPTESWYREHMPPVKAALEDGTLQDLPRDADTLADLRAVQMVRGVPRVPDTRSKGEDKGQRHGDAAVAVALAWFASREINHGPVKAVSRPRAKQRRIAGTDLAGF